MPTSAPIIISDIIRIVKDLNPKSILDVGCGFGKYGLLFREYLEVMQGRYFKDEWITKIDCAEPYEPYITDVHRFVYNSIRVQDIRDIPEDNFKNYDLVFMGDVIEHFKKEEAVNIIKKITEHTDLLVSTPNIFVPQGAYMDNSMETHKCVFTAKELKNLNAKTLENQYMIIALIKCQKKIE